jgi:hypothetical protein
MVWSILSLVGGGTFVYNGLQVLSDPSCDTVSFGGGRVVQVTCYETGAYMSGEFSGQIAGAGMILLGAILIYFAWRNLKKVN